MSETETNAKWMLGMTYAGTSWLWLGTPSQPKRALTIGPNRQESEKFLNYLNALEDAAEALEYELGQQHAEGMARVGPRAARSHAALARLRELRGD